jgi:hypothetical protein
LTEESAGTYAGTTGARAGDERSSTTHQELLRHIRNITPEIVDEARKHLEAGESIEDILRYLQESGADAIDSIIFMRAFCGMSTKQAQTTLHSSDAWSELRGR